MGTWKQGWEYWKPLRTRLGRIFLEKCDVDSERQRESTEHTALQAGGQEFDPPHLHQNGRVAQVVRAHA